MKYNYYFFIILLILILCNSCSQNPLIVNGLFIMESEKITPLIGEWKFSWKAEEKTEIIIQPGCDTSNWDNINVPSFWNYKTHEGIGYAWYHLKILFNEKMNISNMGLFIEKAHCNYELYANGELIIKNGYTGLIEEKFIPTRPPRLVKLPPSHEISLAWKIVNYHDANGGAIRPPVIGNYEILQRNQFAWDIFCFLLVGFIISLGIYHLAIFLGRKNEKSYLYFSIICFFLPLRHFGSHFLFERILLLSNNIIYLLQAKAECLFAYLIWCLLLPLFLKEILIPIFKIRFNKIILYSLLICSFLATLIILFSTQYFISQYHIVYSLFFIFVSLWMGYLLIHSLIIKIEHSFVLLFGYILFFLITVIIEIFTVNGILTNQKTGLIGFLFLSTSQALVLSKKYKNALNEAEYLSKNLKIQVNERTKKLQQANEKIEQQSRQKTTFFINLVHETKTPLTLILNSINDFLKNKKLTPELKVLQSNIQKLCRDITNLLDSEKIEKGLMKYNHNSIINTSKALQQIITLFQPLAQKRNIILSYNESNATLSLKIDPDAFDRIINNIIDNAIRYTPEHGRISVLLESSDKNIFIKVENSGKGISNEHLENIFLPYYQVSREKRNIQGLGMGLFIVKYIIDSMKGKIKIKSELDKGTKVIITLPGYHIKKDDVIEEFIPKEPTLNSGDIKLLEEKYEKDKYTVLIVEDNIELIAFMPVMPNSA